ncbi:MAG: cyclic nucleotide-binding domain-containing protein [Planctomycetota bacterium]|jgi:CRP-like cAMP-binding protein
MAVDKLRKQDIFQLLRPEQVNILSEASKAVKFEAGEMIYSRGANADRFYIVLKGQVSLRLPGTKAGLSMLIDELAEGDMFGGCVSTALDAYALNAQCTVESEVLVISVSALQSVMDTDPRIGYVIQSRISEIYFRRYIETMEKLQAIIMNIPVEPA